jgi:multidrug resistance efflux pump
MLTPSPQSPETLDQKHDDGVAGGGNTTGDATARRDAAASDATTSEDASLPHIYARAHDQTSVIQTGGSLNGKSLMVNVVIPLLILIVGAGVVVALGSTEPKARPVDDMSPTGRLRRLPAAEVTPVYSLQDIGKPLELRVDGVVVPHREVQLAAEVSGRIIEKSPICRAGNFVEAGQLLVKIDPTDYEQAVQRLSRMREQDYEALKEIDQEIANAELSLAVAEQDILLAEREVNRLQSLPKGFVSEGEQDQAQKALLTSTQNRLAVKNQINLLNARRGKLEASERLATTELETAQIDLKRCEVRSAADGVIVREDAELNSFIQRGSPIVTLEDVSKAEVAINLRMDQLAWVLDQSSESRLSGPIDGLTGKGVGVGEGAGNRSSYSLPRTPAVIEYEVAGMAGRKLRWNGALVRYDGIGLDTRSRTVPVKVEVERPDRLIGEDGSESQAAGPSPLVRGMFVSVRLLITPQTPLVAIPAEAIRPGNRVWHFAPDPSVLTDVAASESAGTIGEAAAMATADQSAAGENAVDETAASESNGETAAQPAVGVQTKSFDPSEWTPGRVSVRDNITPVDSLYIAEPLAGDGSAAGDEKATAGLGGSTPGRSAMAGPQRRFWICDVRGSGIESGDWVVVSPLGELGRDIGDTALPVRVKSDQVKP